MKSMPWQDIYPAANWQQFITDYLAKKITSKSTTFGDRFHRRRRIDATLAQLTRDITTYHGIEKRSIENLIPRANMLRGIAHTGQTFLNQYRIGEKGSANAAQKGSLDYAVTKLVRKAHRKAEYLDQLHSHVTSPDKGGRAGNKTSLLEYLNRDKVRAPDLVGMVKDVRLEKLDPWHRPFELEISSEFKYYKPDHLINAVFQLWQWDNTTDLPLFVWMEGHYVCTGTFRNDRWGEYTRGWVEDSDNPVEMPVGRGQVSYNTNQTLHLVMIRGGRLQRWSPGSSDTQPLHTLDASGKPGDTNTIGMYAYVWDKHGQIFTTEHSVGGFHHSSFTSGKKVKCAGMIKADNGKVTRVSNNSGHYKPGTRYLKNFVAFLRDKNILTQDAKVEDHRTVYTAREFLMLRPTSPRPPRPPLQRNKPRHLL